MPSSIPEIRSAVEDRKSTRLNSSHLGISYAVFCLKKKDELAPRPLLRLSRLGLGCPFQLLGRAQPRSQPPRHPYRLRLGLPVASEVFVFFKDRAPPESYPLSLHRALPF